MTSRRGGERRVESGGAGHSPACGLAVRAAFRCSASMRNEKLLFTNFGREAPHRRDLESADAWLARCLAPAGEPPNAAALAAPAPAARRSQSPFLDLPDFNIWRVHFDALHTLDLGIYLTVMCSVLKELLQDRAVFDGRNIGVRLKQASYTYRRWCKLHKPAAVVREFTWRWVGGRFPCISQHHCKAAAARGVMQWLCEVCQPLRATNNRLRARMLQAYLRAEAVMASGGKWLTPAEQAALAAAAEEALELNNALAARSLARGTHVYKLLPKHHVRASVRGGILTVCGCAVVRPTACSFARTTHDARKQTNRPTIHTHTQNKPTNHQTNKQTNKQRNIHTARQASRQAGRQANTRN